MTADERAEREPDDPAGIADALSSALAALGRAAAALAPPRLNRAQRRAQERAARRAR